MFNEMIENVVGQKYMYVWDVIIPVVIFRDFKCLIYKAYNIKSKILL